MIFRRLLIASSMVAIASTFAIAGDGVNDFDIGLSKTSVFNTPDPEVFVYDDTRARFSKSQPRAFHGAPPQVPHEVESMLPITLDDNQCLECHDRPLWQNGCREQRRRLDAVRPALQLQPVPRTAGRRRAAGGQFVCRLRSTSLRRHGARSCRGVISAARVGNGWSPNRRHPGSARPVRSGSTQPPVSPGRALPAFRAAMPARSRRSNGVTAPVRRSTARPVRIVAPAHRAVRSVPSALPCWDAVAHNKHTKQENRRKSMHNRNRVTQHENEARHQGRVDLHRMPSRHRAPTAR